MQHLKCCQDGLPNFCPGTTNFIDRKDVAYHHIHLIVTIQIRSAVFLSFRISYIIHSSTRIYCCCIKYCSTNQLIWIANCKYHSINQVSCCKYCTSHHIRQFLNKENDSYIANYHFFGKPNTMMSKVKWK